MKTSLADMNSVSTTSSDSACFYFDFLPTQMDMVFAMYQQYLVYMK